MSPKKTLVLALAIVAGVNIFVLGGITYNRSGQEASFSLTERELTLATMDKENTSLSLSLDIKQLEELPEKKLRELGFNLDRKFKRDWHQFPSKKIYVALEYEGPAWQKWLAKNDAAMAKDKRLLQTAQQNHSPKEDLKDIQERIDNLISNRETESHLFPVEVALDAAALRAAYPDRARVAIVPALLEVNSYLLDKKRVYNSVLRLLNDGIHVDQAFRPFFLGLKDTNKNYWDRQGKKETVHWVPRYQATLAFGKRFEPWLAEVEGSSRP